mmetsp:Transcript_49895/g.142749  ORF Transcript_49895/g.142749 Transcript_49895/m.142749 type:complete len:212 (+) Transcript_49895:762-1397(+)
MGWLLVSDKLCLGEVPLALHGALGARVGGCLEAEGLHAAVPGRAELHEDALLAQGLAALEQLLTQGPLLGWGSLFQAQEHQQLFPYWPAHRRLLHHPPEEPSVHEDRDAADREGLLCDVQPAEGRVELLGVVDVEDNNVPSEDPQDAAAHRARQNVVLQDQQPGQEEGKLREKHGPGICIDEGIDIRQDCADEAHVHHDAGPGVAPERMLT